eukprot:TRINITY_DN7001_c0_g1_i4.p1 TRINITY_DN7001_c0_g1~~TRINITY_DN7001_c0_g1_i4.p1  ORF type:complete len:399 (-),score=50.38 TRINITY_DN7001_c0_g1_i4:173-1324(-)
MDQSRIPTCDDLWKKLDDVSTSRIRSMTMDVDRYCPLQTVLPDLSNLRTLHVDVYGLPQLLLILETTSSCCPVLAEITVNCTAYGPLRDANDLEVRDALKNFRQLSTLKIWNHGDPICSVWNLLPNLAIFQLESYSGEADRSQIMSLNCGNLVEIRLFQIKLSKELLESISRDARHCRRLNLVDLFLETPIKLKDFLEFHVVALLESLSIISTINIWLTFESGDTPPLLLRNQKFFKLRNLCVDLNGTTDTWNLLFAQICDRFPALECLALGTGSTVLRIGKTEFCSRVRGYPGIAHNCLERLLLALLLLDEGGPDAQMEFARLIHERFPRLKSMPVSGYELEEFFAHPVGTQPLELYNLDFLTALNRNVTPHRVKRRKKTPN